MTVHVTPGLGDTVEFCALRSVSHDASNVTLRLSLVNLPDDRRDEDRVRAYLGTAPIGIARFDGARFRQRNRGAGDSEQANREQKGEFHPVVPSFAIDL